MGKMDQSSATLTEGTKCFWQFMYYLPQNAHTGRHLNVHINTAADPGASLLQHGAFSAPLTPEEDSCMAGGRGKEKTS